MDEGLADTGLFASLRRMLATLLVLVKTRLELAGVEIELHLEYAAESLLWSIAAILFGSLTVLMLALTIVIAFWETHRLLAAGLVTVTFAASSLVAVLVIRYRFRHRPRFLAATVDELKQDAAALEGESP